MLSLCKSTSHDLFDVVFPCHDGVMVCSQAAVVWWQASLSMKSFLLTSRCMFVTEWLAPQIMEGLTIRHCEHSFICPALKCDRNVCALWSVLQICILTFICLVENIEHLSQFVYTLLYFFTYFFKASREKGSWEWARYRGADVPRK